MSARLAAWSLAMLLLIPRAFAAPSADVVQHVGAALPLDVRLADERGHEAALARFFGDVPVVLVFGYYNCPTLCTTLMEGALLALDATGLPGEADRVVGVSIDPRERALDALRRAAAYRETFDAVRLDLLTGREAEVRRLAAAAGYTYAFDTRFDQYAHPLGFMVVSAGGRIARYFPGVAFDSREVRLALIEASEARIGSLSERIFLRCAHYDPASGRYSFAVMSAVRALCLLVFAILGFWMWRRRAA
jgi:protein SCO1/2